MSQEFKKNALIIKTDLAAIKNNDGGREEAGNARASIVLWVVSAIIIAQLLSIIPDIIETIGKLIS